MDSLRLNIAIERAYQAHAAGRAGEARLLGEEVLKVQRDNLQALHLLAIIAFDVAQYDEAAAFVRRCLAVRPRDASFNYRLGRVFAAQGKYDEAIVQFDKAERLMPGAVEAIAAKADVFERRGDRAGALAILQPMIDAGSTDEGIAVIRVRILESEGRLQEAVDLANGLLCRPPGDMQCRRLLLRQIGRVHDRLGNYREAFEAFSRAGADASIVFDPDEYAARIDDLIATFSRDNLRRLPRASNTSEIPVFIACMPRSGSTLVEQIIHAHPQAFGAGELNHISALVTNLAQRIESFQPYPSCLADFSKAKLDKEATAYLSVLKRLAPTALRVTNKDVTNYLHLGVIALLFPKARIVHICRDRLDNGFACFMAALSSQMFPWVANLEHIGHAWRQYERLMDHWRTVLDLPILEVSYEDLVDDTEVQIRRIIDFCGLEWNDRCLRYWEVDRNVMTLSYDQVRRPIFKTAVKRYERYKEFLGPLNSSLNPDSPSAQ